MTPPLDAWGLTGTAVPLTGGHRNTVLRVGDFVLKTTRRSEAAIAWLLPVFQRLERYGLRAPHPIRSARGGFIAEGWICEPFVTGTPCNPLHLRAAWPRVTRSSGNIPQRPGFAAARTLCRMPRGGDIDLTRLPPVLARALRTAWRALDHARPCIVHADLNSSNLILTGDGIAIIDWDEARVDHPGFDRAALGIGTRIETHAALAWEIACSWQLEPHHARTRLRAFTSAMAPRKP